MSSRLQNFVIDSDPTGEGDGAENIMGRELKGSLLSRTLLPLMKNIFKFLGRFTPEQVLHDLDHKLIIARNPYNLKAPEFFGIRIFLSLAGIGLGALLISRDASLTNIAMGVGVAILLFILPALWLRLMMNKVQEEIRRALPDALDMLSVCATAGLGFDQSLQRVGETWETGLGLEFRRVVQEMNIGIARTEALRNLGKRLEVTELSNLVAIIIQAETMGMRIADVLHSQAEQMRVMRQFRAKEVASKLPAKMMVPLALCILPALMAVIMGPMIPIFLESFA